MLHFSRLGCLLYYNFDDNSFVFCISQGWGLILKSTCLSLDSNRVLNNALGTNNSFKWCVFGVESISGKA